MTALRADCLRTRLCIEEIMRSLGLPLPEVPDGIGDPVKLAPKNGGES